jgi:hypothetical protein
LKRNNKIIIGVLAVLILVVAVIGFTSYSKDGNTNSTYNGKEVSFVYPSDYTITQINGNGALLNLKGEKTVVDIFTVQKVMINESFDQYVNQTKHNVLDGYPTINPKLVNETNLTVNGSKVYQMNYVMVIHGITFNNTYTIFDKNSSRYVIYFSGANTNYYSNIVLNSFKVKDPSKMSIYDQIYDLISNI